MSPIAWFANTKPWGTFSIIGPVKAGANAIKSHRTGSYDVN